MCARSLLLGNIKFVVSWTRRLICKKLVLNLVDSSTVPTLPIISIGANITIIVPVPRVLHLTISVAVIIPVSVPIAIPVIVAISVIRAPRPVAITVSSVIVTVPSIILSRRVASTSTRWCRTSSSRRTITATGSRFTTGVEAP